MLSKNQIFIRSKVDINEDVKLEQLCEIVGIRYEDIVSQSRHGAVRDYRHVLAAYIHAQGHSSTRVGEMLGGRDHATVLHSTKRVVDFIETKDAFVMGLLNKIGSSDLVSRLSFSLGVNVLGESDSLLSLENQIKSSKLVTL